MNYAIEKAKGRRAYLSSSMMLMTKNSSKMRTSRKMAAMTAFSS